MTLRRLLRAATVFLLFAKPVFSQSNPTAGLDALIDSAPTRVTKQAGDYFAPATWGGQVPGAHDTARIDHAVTCTNQPIAITTLIVNARGSYTDLFDDGNCDITITDAPLDLSTDPQQYGHGILVLGRWHVEGAPKQRWTRLTTDLLAGSQSLRAADTGAWTVGDRLVVPGIRPAPGARVAPQVYTVTGLADEVTLDRQVTAPAPASRDENGRPERYAPIGNLSTSVVIRSANPQGVRGHFLATRDASVTIKHAAFRDFGRTTNQPLHATTNHIGRYNLHLHHMTGPALIEGVVIERAVRWGLTVHHTNNGVFRDNLVYDAWGAGIMTEDGTETGNLFERNLVIAVTGTGDRGDERANFTPRETGVNGAALWFEGPHNVMRGNIGTNSTEGITVYGQTAPGSGLRLFEDNEGINNGHNLSIWWLHSRQPTYVDRFYSWNGGMGYYGYPTTNVIFRDFTSRGTLPNNGTGWWAGDYSTMGGQLIRPRISGYHWGMLFPYGATDNPPPDVMREFRVTDGVLAGNDVDITTRRGPVSSWGGIQPHLVSRVVNTQLRSRVAIRREVDLGGGGRLGPHPDQLFVEAHQGVTGDDFEVLHDLEAPSGALTRPGIGKVRVGSVGPSEPRAADWAPSAPTPDVAHEHPSTDSSDGTHATNLTVAGSTWTIRAADGATLRDGEHMAYGRAHAAQGTYALCSGDVLVLGIDLNWWRWAGSTWILQGPHDPCAPAVTASEPGPAGTVHEHTDPTGPR